MSKLLEEILGDENMTKALEKVKSKKGAGGIDGMTVEEAGNRPSPNTDCGTEL